MGEHEDRSMVWRVLAPPALPALVPPAVAAAEHVAAHDVGADVWVGRYLVHDRGVRRLGPPRRQALHPGPGGGLEHPLVQALAALAERVLEALIRSRTEDVERDRLVAPNDAHCSIRRVSRPKLIGRAVRIATSAGGRGSIRLCIPLFAGTRGLSVLWLLPFAGTRAKSTLACCPIPLGRGCDAVRRRSGRHRLDTRQEDEDAHGSDDVAKRRQAPSKVNVWTGQPTKLISKRLHEPVEERLRQPGLRAALMDCPPDPIHEHSDQKDREAAPDETHF